MAPAGPSMRKFLTELKGKSVTSSDGQVLGEIDDFVLETTTGAITFALVTPAEPLKAIPFPQDSTGRLVVPVKSLRADKDVVVVDLGK